MHIHKQAKLPVLPPVLTPIELETLPSSPELPMVPPLVVNLPPVPIAAAAATPRRERRRLAPKTAVAPAEESTPQPMTDEAAIGDLTAGGAANPQAQQEAAELIRSIEKRLNGLTAPTQRKKRSQLNRVRNFWRQAQEALSSGDIEGAKTLATKAKLLLDDLDKQDGGE